MVKDELAEIRQRHGDKGRWCQTCSAFTDHHTDEHDPSDPVADAHVWAERCREAIRQGRKGEPA